MFAFALTTKWFTSFLPANIAGDITFWLIFIAASIAIGMYLGRSQLVNVVLYTYIDIALLGVIPSEWLNFAPPYGQVIAFGAILLIMLAMGDYLFDIHIPSASSDFFWRILVMGFLTAGMLLSQIMLLLPKKLVLVYISAPTYVSFAEPMAHLIWLILPLFMLFFINKRLQ